MVMVWALRDAYFDLKTKQNKTKQKEKVEITINNSVHSIEFVAVEHELRFAVIDRIRANFVHRNVNRAIDPIAVA